MLSYRATAIKIEYKDFLYVKALGTGQYGDVAAYRYSGDHPAIRALANSENLIALKTYKGLIDSNELELENALFLKDNPSAKFVQQLVALSETSKYHLISELITIEDTSADVRNYIAQRKGFFAYHEHGAASLNYFLLKISQAMIDGLDELNRKGMLHIDTTNDNFMMTSTRDEQNNLQLSVKLIDFGLSRCVNLSDGKTKITYDNKQIRMPFTRFNRETIESFDRETAKPLVTVEFSLLTDLFNRKITLLDMLGAIIGMKNEEVLSLDSISPNDLPDVTAYAHLSELDLYFYKRHRMLDTQCLATYFTNVMKFAEKIGNEDPRSQYVQQFLTVFKPYLLTMPEANMSYTPMLNDDLALFNSCHAIFSQNNPLPETTPAAVTAMLANEAVSLSHRAVKIETTNTGVYTSGTCTPTAVTVDYATSPSKLNQGLFKVPIMPVTPEKSVAQAKYATCADLTKPKKGIGGFKTHSRTPSPHTSPTKSPTKALSLALAGTLLFSPEVAPTGQEKTEKTSKDYNQF